MNCKRIQSCLGQNVEEDCQPSSKKFRAENEQSLNFNDPPASIFNSLKIPRRKNEQQVASDELLMNTISPITPPISQLGNTSRSTDNPVTKAVVDESTVKLDDKTAKLKYYRCKECHLNLSSQVTLDAHYAGARHAKKLKELEISGASTRSFKKDKISKLAENEFKCKLCDVKLGSLIQMKSHIDGSKHKKSMVAYREKKDKLKNESSFNTELVNPTSQPVNDDKPIVKTEPKTKSSFNCSICDLSMNSQLQYDQHINSKKHSTKVTKLSCIVKVESKE